MAILIAPLLVLVIGALIVVPQTFYTVDETQVAIVTEFGEFKSQHTTPGLRAKTPFVQQVQKFDKRLLRVEAPPASVLTSDKRNLVIDAYARYRITDPLLFFQTLQGEREADSRVGDIVASELRREVALDLQEEVIGPRREEIMKRVTDAANRFEVPGSEALTLPAGLRTPAPALFVALAPLTDTDTGTSTGRSRAATGEEIAELERAGAPAALGANKVTYFVPIATKRGIEIVDVRIKRADFPPDIANSVYLRMRAERERIASGLRAEGSQRDAEIRAEVDRDVRVLTESAQGTAARLLGEAEQEAITILADALEQDPEFYSFRRSLEAYKAALATDTTIFLDPGSDLFKYLQDPSGTAAE